MDFAVLADPRAKIKENENRDKYLDVGREIKKKWNMKVTVIPIVIGAHQTIAKGLIKRLEDLEIRRRMETIQTTVFLRSVRIPRRILETWGNFLLLRLQRKTLS